MEENKQEPSAADEREVLIQTLDLVRKIFESRAWIMEGRGAYPYNDEKYREEVRYMYNEFDALMKNVWGNIKSKSNEYRMEVIMEHLRLIAENPVEVQVASRLRAVMRRQYSNPTVLIFPVACGAFFYLKKFIAEQSVGAVVIMAKNCAVKDSVNLGYKADTELIVFDEINLATEEFQKAIHEFIVSGKFGDARVVFTCHSTMGLISEFNDANSCTIKA